MVVLFFIHLKMVVVVVWLHWLCCLANIDDYVKQIIDARSS